MQPQHERQPASHHETHDMMAELLNKPHTLSELPTQITVEIPAVKLVVSARCNRKVVPHKWELIFDDGTEILVARGVITQVKFTCKLIPGERYGCGGRYAGYARGTFDPME